MICEDPDLYDKINPCFIVSVFAMIVPPQVASKDSKQDGKC